MGLRPWRGSGSDAAEIAVQTASGVTGGAFAAVLSAIALAVSGYSLWDTSLKAADVRVFVPRVIYYSSPYQNTNFEMISIPVTFSNEGARTGTVLDLDLAVTDPRTKKTKHFYAAEIGVWSMARTRDRAYTGFAPISLEGRSSRTEPILFYTRGEGETPEQLIRETGAYEFTLTATEAEDDPSLLPFGKAHKTPISVSFTRSLPFYDARVFENGTIFMHADNWKTSASKDGK